MSNRDVAVGERYWHNTFFDNVALLSRGMGLEGGPDEPPKFKSYPGRQGVRLPTRLPSGLGPITAAFNEHVPTAGSPAGLHATKLGTLLHYGYGLSRVDMGPVAGWPYHRVVPSARCFYPTELYVCLPAGSGFAAGIYHYDQLHHALVPLRAGDHRELLSEATGADLCGSAAVMLITSHFWKTAFRYRHYAYRLCTQEAGMVAGNLLLVGASLRLAGGVHFQFLDEVVDRLLGLVSGEERTMAVLPFQLAGKSFHPSRDAAQLLERISPIDVPIRDVPKDLDLAADTYEIDVKSVIAEAVELRQGPAGPPGGARDADLVRALRQRNSGGTFFKPAREPVSAQDFRRLELAATPYRSDLGAAPLCEVHLVAEHVTDVAAGVYRLPDFTRTAEPPDGGLPLGSLGPPVVDLTAVNVLCYLVTDREVVTERFGNRGYRIANADAGIVAQRVCVLAGAAGLAARPINGYQVPEVQRLLGITDPMRTPMFQIAVGHRTASAQYEMPIVF